MPTFSPASGGVAEAVSVDAHLERVLAGVAPLGRVEAVRLADAAGRTLATSVDARVDLPSFDNSAMDGYAVRFADVAAATADAPVVLDVVADLPAGSDEQVAVGSGQAARIMTGAPVPDGADAVVLVERTSTDGDVVTIEIGVEPGTSIRGV
ncbi:MAG TPA: molybdenum cofactor synthesis protein, partial [Agromyces sp.]|nr:molybdenum cofactor synthesis protein [Agromyces sp.]